MIIPDHASQQSLNSCQHSSYESPGVNPIEHIWDMLGPGQVIRSLIPTPVTLINQLQ